MMELCPSCKSGMNPGATVCHTCGRDATEFQRKKVTSNILGGCFLVIVGFFVVSYCASKAVQTTSTTSHSRTGHAAASAPNACDVANALEKRAATELDTNYQASYDDSVKGLRSNENCTSGNGELVNHAFLLSMKAFAEHHLSSGDSRTDLNQANTLLEECITTPGLYGTSTGASCETQMQNNIRTQTDWEMNQ